MSPPLSEEIAAAASQLAFGKKVVQNDLRALVVEVIVHYGLKPDWRHCSEDWNGWDFEHKDGTRLEVKQSAAQQTWAAPRSKPSLRFDIRERSGYWESGITWISRPGRYAQIYIFAYHGISGETADHRDSSQWRFHVVRTSRLPATRTIGLSTIAALSPAFEWSALFEAVERERRHL
jgi:hypothetical protein